MAGQMPPPQQYANEDALRRQLGATRQVTLNTTEFVRTRDALVASYMNLSQSIDDAVKAYLNHTNVIIHSSGGALNASLLIKPFTEITESAQQVAQQALRAQGNDSIDPQLLQNGQPAANGQNGSGDDKKKRTKRAYKQRDPNAPKRPLTAYFRYLGEMRPLIMEEVKENPDKFEEAGKPGDISKIATKRWNLLSEAQQEPYKQAYKDALGAYNQKVKKYKESTGQDVPDSKAEIDPELEAEEEEEEAEAGAAAPAAAATKDKDDSDSETDSDSDASGESNDEADAKPAPPPPVKKAAATPKSAPKKGAKQAQTFSSIPEQPTATPAQEKASSPAKKRKAATEAEDTTKSSKKKSRKSVTAGADPVESPAPAAAATTESSPPATTDKAGKKAKKDKKKRKSSVEA